MKKIVTLAVLFLLVIASSVNATTYTTTKRQTTNGFTVTASAYWDYETGKYSTKGPHVVNDKPFHILYYIDVEFLVQNITSDRYTVTQYFRPTYTNMNGLVSYKTPFGIELKTQGPR